MKISWRSPELFNEPGLFMVVWGKSICLLPWKAK